MPRESKRLRRSSPAQLAAVCAGVWLLCVCACATESSDPLEDGASGSVADRAGTSGSGGAPASTAGKPGGGVTTGGTSGKAGAASMAGAAGSATAGAGGKASGGASAGGAGGTTGGGGNGNVAGKAGATQGGSSSGTGGGGNGAGGGSGGGATCGTGVAFCDDFEDHNANGWTKSGGTWTVLADGGDWVYEGGNGSEEAYAGDVAWTDQTVEANVKVISFGGTSDSYRAGIMARRSGGSSFYVFALGADGNLTLRKSTSTPSGSSGTCAPIAAGIDGTAWFTLKMTVSGPASSVRIRTYLNGTLKHDCTTTSSTVVSGQAGLLTYGSNTVAHFDDVSVTTP
jgi:hypothetical protein